jgi:hypothetical protein
MGYEMLLEMRKFVAPEIIFGLGALDMAGEYAKKLGANHAFFGERPWGARGGLDLQSGVQPERRGSDRYYL